MTKYVLSTATCSQRIVSYLPGNSQSGVNTIDRSVRIKGGANAASSSSGFGDMTHTPEGQPLWTPRGVVTEVSDEDAAFLESHPTFIDGVKAGFFQMMDKGVGTNHDKVKKLATGMTERDLSAPLTSATLKSQVKVTTKLELDA